MTAQIRKFARKIEGRKENERNARKEGEKNIQYHVQYAWHKARLFVGPFAIVAVFMDTYHARYFGRKSGKH